MKLYQLHENTWIDGMFCYAGDYVFTEDQRVEVIHIADLPRGYKGDNPRLTVYKAVKHENRRTHETSIVWDCIADKGRVTRLVWTHFYNKYVRKPDPYAGIRECQQNSMPKRGKCHPLTRSRNGFDGMIPLSYGEQCIARTFESHRNTVTYNAEIM